MSYELTFEHFNQLKTLFEAFPYDRAWLDSAFREPARARAFVEEGIGGPLVLLCLESGDCFMAGEIAAEKVKALLNYVFELARPQTINYIGLPQADWSKLITGQFPEQLAELPRVQLEFDAARFLAAKKSLPPLPQEFELTRIDLALARRIGQELDPDFTEFWPNPEDFLARGAGLCITQQAQIVSVAYSAFAPYRLFEMAIATHQDFRGRGLATQVSAALIEECLVRGYRPHWSAEAENQASRHTGHKLGFGNEQPYMWLKYTQHKLNGKEP